MSDCYSNFKIYSLPFELIFVTLMLSQSVLGEAFPRTYFEISLISLGTRTIVIFWSNQECSTISISPVAYCTINTFLVPAAIVPKIHNDIIYYITRCEIKELTHLPLNIFRISLGTRCNSQASYEMKSSRNFVLEIQEWRHEVLCCHAVHINTTFCKFTQDFNLKTCLKMATPIQTKQCISL